jgi:IclR family pca regulon transcriptional regulator
MTVGITIGTRFPAYATSMGRVLLAQLSPDELTEALRAAEPIALTERTITGIDALAAEIARVRDQGWAIVDGELEAGLRALAVPVRGRDGRAAAAVNVSTTTSTGSIELLREHHLPLLLETARAIEADLLV